MFKSRKKAKIESAAAENAVYFAQALQDTQRVIAEARKIAEVGERYLALMEIETRIQGFLDEAIQRAENQVEKLETHRRKRAGAGIGTMAVGAVTITVAAVSAPIIASAALTTAIIGGSVLYVTGSAPAILVICSPGGKLAKKITASKDSFCAAMKELLENATSKKDAILRDELPDLLISPCIETLCNRAPAVQTAFAKAAIKEGVFSPPVRLDKPSYPNPKQ